VRLKIFVIAEMKSFVFVRDGDITSVLIGASRPSQVSDNIGMIRNTSFSEEERRRIDEILEERALYKKEIAF
jgi:L-glyceraldehyde 3-phosphate reductase